MPVASTIIFEYSNTNVGELEKLLDDELAGQIYYYLCLVAVSSNKTFDAEYTNDSIGENFQEFLRSYN